MDVKGRKARVIKLLSFAVVCREAFPFPPLVLYCRRASIGTGARLLSGELQVRFLFRQPSGEPTSGSL